MEREILLPQRQFPTSCSERHYFVFRYHVVKINVLLVTVTTNKDGSLQTFLVKCVGSELHYNESLHNVMTS